MALPRNCLKSVALAVLLAGMPAIAQAAVVISSDPTSNMNCASGVCKATAKNAVLNADELVSMLAASNVKVKTGKRARDIDVVAPVSWASRHRLTLDAYQGVSIEGPVTVAGPGSLTVATDDGGSGGVFSFNGSGHVTFWDLGSGLVINGAAYTLVNTLPSLVAAISTNPSGFYALASDYDASADGVYTDSPVGTPFAGSFVGLGNAIANFSIDRELTGPPDVYFALFAQVNSGATIANLRLTNVNLFVVHNKNASAASLVGSNAGTLFDDHVTGQIGKAIYSGGLVALNRNSGVIERCSSTVDVNGDWSGGLVATNAGLLGLSFATGSVRAAGPVAGGLAGVSNSGQINDSYATGAVKDVNRSDSTGVGGLASTLQATAVTRSYSTGVVQGEAGVHLGGFVGISSDDVTIADSYWDVTTSGTDQGTGAGNVQGLSGLTTEQFQSGLPSGFDPAVWAEDPGINGGYPYLIANPPAL
jgi:hypothetical protein